MKPHRLTEQGAPVFRPDERPFWEIGGGRALPDILAIGPSKHHGYGIFARHVIPAYVDLGPMALTYGGTLVRVGALGALLNHSYEPNIKRELTFTTGYWHVWTLGRIEQGQELLLTYKNPPE